MLRTRLGAVYFVSAYNDTYTDNGVFTLYMGVDNNRVDQVLILVLNEIAKLRKLKTTINILKIPGVNTKQNLSLLSRKLPNFRDLISRDKKILNKVFFKN